MACGREVTGEDGPPLSRYRPVVHGTFSGKSGRIGIREIAAEWVHRPAGKTRMSSNNGLFDAFGERWFHATALRNVLSFCPISTTRPAWASML